MNREIIVFAPHPDDETIGCGGTIAKKVKEGNEVLVVFLTDGRNAFYNKFSIDSDPSPDEVKEIRKNEAKKALKILGVEEDKIYFLEYEDGKLKKFMNEALEKITDILRTNPSPIEVYYPYEKDCHVDHQVTNIIVRKAIEILHLKTKKYKYSVIRNYARFGPWMDLFINFFKHNIVSFDISEFLPLKIAALNEFKSVVTIISEKQKRPLEKGFNKFIKKEESFFVDK